MSSGRIPRNPNLLFVGTDVGAYVSTDMGGHWQKFMNGLPTVPVHDLKIHPRDRELIAATHGRSIWIVDIAPLEEMTDQVMAAPAYLFEPVPGLQFGNSPIGGESTGPAFLRGPIPKLRSRDRLPGRCRSGSPGRGSHRARPGTTVPRGTDQGGGKWPGDGPGEGSPGGDHDPGRYG